LTDESDPDHGISARPSPGHWMTAAEREFLWHELNYQHAIRADAGLPPLDLSREFDLAAGRVAVNLYRQALAPYVMSALKTVPISPGMVTTF
jgi:hypothetical protein